MELLKEGNSKLGRLVACFSLPVNETTCPGSTEVCRSVCYACDGFFRMPSVKKSLEDSLERSLLPSFVDDVVMTIRLQRHPLVRIHVSGDFYSPEYVRKWMDICQRSPQTSFLAYTRTWRNDHQLLALQELANLPNVALWLSADSETGEPPMRGYPFAGVAYMSVNDYDMPDYPVELVFRNTTRSVMRFADTPGRVSLVCPAEQGTGIKMTCTQCRYCFTRREQPRWKARTARTTPPTLPPLARHRSPDAPRGRVPLRVLT